MFIVQNVRNMILNYGKYFIFKRIAEIVLYLHEGVDYQKQNR